MPSHLSLQQMTEEWTWTNRIPCFFQKLQTEVTENTQKVVLKLQCIASFKVVHYLASSYLPQKSVFLFLFIVLALVLSNSIGCAVQAYYGQFLYMQVSWGFTVANPDYLAPQVYKWTSVPQGLSHLQILITSSMQKCIDKTWVSYRMIRITSLLCIAKL